MTEKKCCATCGLRGVCPHARGIFESALLEPSAEDMDKFLADTYENEVCQRWESQLNSLNEKAKGEK